MALSFEETLPVLVTQIAAMFVMMSIGFVLFKVKMVNHQGVAQMSNIILYAASPCIVMQSFFTDFSMQRLMEAGWCIAFSAIITGVAILLTRCVYGNKQSLSAFSVIFTNSGFIGIPIVQRVLGVEYVFYVSMCIACITFFVWTYGAWLVSQDKGEVSFQKILSNPGIITLFIGLFMFVFSIRLGPILKASISGIADINAGVAMIVLGAYLAEANLLRLIMDKWIYLAGFLRLIAMPLITLVLLRFAPITQAIKLVLYITFATPSGALTAMFSQKYEKDYEYGVGLVATSTLLSLFTMPMMMTLALMYF